MKKIKNMNFREAREAFSKWKEKHPRHDDFDMSGLAFAQAMEITKGIDREAIAEMISDLFSYGFMAGYMQAGADLKAKVNNRMKGEYHRKLLDLVYYLPFGYKTDYFYYMMVYMLPADCFRLFPKRIAEPAIAVRAERESGKAREAEQKQEKEAVHNG